VSIAAGPFAALTGVSAAIQPEGPWQGRWQIAARFASDAQTAMMYTPAALAEHVRKLSSRTSYHSVVFAGSGVLSEEPFIAESLELVAQSHRVMIETDGQRPDSIAAVAGRLALLQIGLDASASREEVDRAMDSLAAASGRCDHALIVHLGPETSDERCLQLVERAATASAGTMLVVHPEDPPHARDPRWAALLQRATVLHPDVRLLPKLSAPRAR